MSKRTPLLPGQSRSAACLTKACNRLRGHHGDHRSTLTVEAPKALVPVTVRAYTKAGAPAPTSSAVTVVLDTVVLGYRVVVLSDGFTASQKVEQAPAKAAAKVTVVPFAEPKSGRIGVNGPVGQHRTAKRAKAGPRVGQREVTIAESI